MECFRRLALASVVGIVDAGSAVSALLGVLICIAFLFVFIRWEPYKAKEDSDLGVVLSYALTFFFLSALLVKVDIISDGKSEQQLFGIVLIMLLGSGPIAIVLQLSKGKMASWLRVCGDLVSTPEDAKEDEQKGENDDQEDAVQDDRNIELAPRMKPPPEATTSTKPIPTTKSNSPPEPVQALAMASGSGSSGNNSDEKYMQRSDQVRGSEIELAGDGDVEMVPGSHVQSFIGDSFGTTI